MMLSIPLSEEELEALERVAAREGRTAEQVARTAILEHVSGWRRERERLVEAILSEDAAVLRRLGRS
jgi:hypothetical protein